MRIFLLTFMVVFYAWSPLHAEPLKIIFGISRPPFIIEEKQTGISFELAKVIFDRLGVSFSPSFGPNKRMKLEILKSRVDVAVEVTPFNPTLFYSEKFISYRNFVVSRKADGIAMKDFTDLKGQSVCAWQDARAHIGERLTQAIGSFSSYREFSIQKDQVREWLIKRCDVILIDDTLLKWHMKELIGKLKNKNRNFDVLLDYHPFPGGNITWFYVAFRDRVLRDRFNGILAEIKKDGTYDRIREGFVSQYK